jgi:site-specific recombinase XerD
MSPFKLTPEVQREIDSYKQFMQNNEYSANTALGYSTYLSRFLRLPPNAHERPLKERVASFLTDQHECNPASFKDCRAALRLYIKMVTGECFTRHKPIESKEEIETVLKRFYDYSLDIKRIQPGTAQSEVSHIRSFLKYATDNSQIRIESFTANEIRDYVVDCLATLKNSSKGRLITSIRNFFRFLKFEGIPVHESVFLIPLSPAVWKNGAVPTTIEESVFNNLHEVPDGDTPIGVRNRCIILCFTELALRCLEVASLTLDDFNWYDGYVSIRNTKNCSDRKLPISEKLGKSITTYLQTVRPITTSRILFVRFKRTCGEPMGVSQIHGVVGRVYDKSGVNIGFTGTHVLRRTAGSKIYNSGNSLKMTADILGHESLDSTVRYVKADIAGLQQVAAPWPFSQMKAGDHDAS